MTLIETLVALAVTGLVIGPLTAAFVTLFDGGAAVQDELDDGNDAARIGAAWTKDVQSVDVGGVNGGGALGAVQPCRGPNPGNKTIEDLVTFSWATSSATPKTATWTAVGTGEDLSLERVYCEGGNYVSNTVLASNIGVDGVGIHDVVKGPDAGNPYEFCPAKNYGTVGSPSLVSDACTIVVDGSIQYRLEVSRRTPERAGTTPAPLPPPAPTIVVGATQARNTYLTVGWTPPTMAAGQPPIDTYQVYVYTDPAGNGPTAVAPVQVSGTTAVVEGLTNGVAYYVRVQAHNAVAWGALTDPYGPLTPGPTEPDAPGVTGTPIEGDTTLTLSWTPNANNGGSNVTSWILSAQPGSGAVVSVTVPHSGAQGDLQTGTIPGLTNGQSYTVRIQGVNSKGAGLSSDSTTALIPYGIPGPATNLLSLPNPDGSIYLDWEPPADNGGRPILGYRVIVDNGPDDPGDWPSDTTWFPAGTTDATLTGFTLGESYSFRVLTNNLRGYSTSASSDPPILSSTLPTAPGSVNVVQGGTAGSLAVNWTAAGDNGSPVLYYEVRTNPVIAGTPKTVTGMTTTFTGLSSGQSYTFYVRARNANGWGPEASAAGVAGGAPNWGGNTPTVVQQAGNTYPFAVNVSWSRPPNTGGLCITKYKVEYSADNGSTVASTNTLTGTPNSSCVGEPGTTFAWGGLPAGVQTRYFRIVAVNSLGDSFAATSGWSTVQMTQWCTVIATEDSWVNESSRNTNYGGDARLEVDKSGDQTYVKFDPRSNGSTCEQFAQQLPASAKVTQGEVQMYNNDPTKYGRDHRIYRTNASWSEYGITYNNRPAVVNPTDTENSSVGGWHYFWVNASDIELQRTDATRHGWNIHDVGGNWLSAWADYRSRNHSATYAPRLRVLFY